MSDSAAWRITVADPGGPDVLACRPHDLRPLEPGTIRVRNAASGVNFIDVYHRTGFYPRPLLEPGRGRPSSGLG